MNNPFKSGGNGDFLKAEQEVKAELSELQRIANDLMADQRYAKFAKIIKEAEEGTVELLLRYKEDDPYKFKAKVDEFLTELRVYRNMVRSTADLANPIPQPKMNLVQDFKSRIKGLLDNL